MKTKIVLSFLTAAAFLSLTPRAIYAQDFDSISPVVVKSAPEAGSKDVSPGVMEIKVTFSKDMTDKSWSWSSAWKDSEPEILEKPKYASDQRTCLIKVKLAPNKTYGYWINSQNFHGFKDKQGHAAIPYLLVFKTKA